MGAVATPKDLKGNDVNLLQRLIAKESEGRIVLASLLWENKVIQDAENEYYTACNRLDQLIMDEDEREAKEAKNNKNKNANTSRNQPKNLNVNNDGKMGMEDATDRKRLSYTIDDIVGEGFTCTNFKKEKIEDDTLVWSETLKKKFT